MKKQFVPYNIALALKEKGYDEGCFGYYDIQSKMLYIADKDEYKISENLPSILCSAPTYQQAINWLFPKLEFNYPMVSIRFLVMVVENGIHPKIEMMVI